MSENENKSSPDLQNVGADSGDRRPHQRKTRYRKKVLDTRNLKLDFKHPEVLERFISKTGKILPRRMTGATAKIQRKIAREIKRSRQINLLPITKR
ncbi:MAG: 30S ribosomal protein S18 [Leptospiraceae bacterium]|nr:30S ribosomal protein S18 [Leptospiraceae bacterium]